MQAGRLRGKQIGKNSKEAKEPKFGKKVIYATSRMWGKIGEFCFGYAYQYRGKNGKRSVLGGRGSKRVKWKSSTSQILFLFVFSFRIFIPWMLYMGILVYFRLSIHLSGREWSPILGAEVSSLFGIYMSWTQGNRNEDLGSLRFWRSTSRRFLMTDLCALLRRFLLSTPGTRKWYGSYFWPDSPSRPSLPLCSAWSSLRILHI